MDALHAAFQRELDHVVQPIRVVYERLLELEQEVARLRALVPAEEHADDHQL
jgi:hypothetical protein